MKRYFLTLSALIHMLGVFGCRTVDPPLVEPGMVVESAPVALPIPEEPSPEMPVVEVVPFDPASVSQEVFDSTKSDVQMLIGRLNELIRAQDYDAWVEYLGVEYKNSLSDPAFLARISDSARLRNKKIVLRDLKDYFIHVVVPSRANDRVDDIEFLGQNRVKAFTITARGQRLRLYNLEKTNQGWKIVN